MALAWGDGKASAKPPAKPAKDCTWYVEIPRGGEHVSAYLCNDAPRLESGFVCFKTIEGESVSTNAPVIIKERPRYTPTQTPKFTPAPASPQWGDDAK